MINTVNGSLSDTSENVNAYTLVYNLCIVCVMVNYYRQQFRGTGL